LTKKTSQLRLRVFAGPNGSGKSTVIKYIRQHKVSGKKLDFGYYVNADDIAQELKSGKYSFSAFPFSASAKEFSEMAQKSGLINHEFPENSFKRCFTLRGGTIYSKQESKNERLAQIIADYIRKKLLSQKQKFSFETVFSHRSKLDLMREAAKVGYKVYLYFVSTESPEINKFYVKARKAKGGHDVPSDKIESRYYRSLELLHDACQIPYQVFFFDNSEEGQDFKMFAHFKQVNGKKKWDAIKKGQVPSWFTKYYSAKITHERRY
jgi:predicted ABC-type ATPase